MTLMQAVRSGAQAIRFNLVIAVIVVVNVTGRWRRQRPAGEFGAMRFRFDCVCEFLPVRGEVGRNSCREFRNHLEVSWDPLGSPGGGKEGAGGGGHGVVALGYGLWVGGFL